MKNLILTLILALIINDLYAQEEKPSWIKENVSFNGYIKYLNTVNFHNGDDLLTDNLLHNRLNLTVYLGENFTIHSGMRNRIFYGDMLKLPFFSASYLDKDNGILDLTFLPINEKNVLMQSTFDRLNVNFNYKKWNIILGRQRINWGINTVWNPNDLFNTSNFLDFDYEEKPGADAVRVIYETGEMSNLEIAYKTDKNFDKKQSIIAAKYLFNYKSYDLQLIAAKYFDDYSIGFGWAGNIKNFGFKGEANYFINQDNGNVLVSSISIDYAFQNGINWMISGLYNGNYHSQNGLLLLNFYNYELTAKNLFPSKYAFFNQFSGNFGAAWNWRVGGIYATENKLSILIPQISYSIKDNWDLDMYMQSFFADIPNIEQRNILNVRLRWSF